MRPFLQQVSKVAHVYVHCYPNAGLPNAMGGYDETAEVTASYVRVCTTHNTHNNAQQQQPHTPFYYRNSLMMASSTLLVVVVVPHQLQLLPSLKPLLAPHPDRCPLYLRISACQVNICFL